MESRQAFLEILLLLENYLSDVVICGGWVPFIYKEYVVNTTCEDVVKTDDLDIATPHTLPLRNQTPVDTILKQAGFQERLFGDSIPPPVHYVHDGKFSKIEFLTYKRRQETTRRVQPGLNAQALGFLVVLLDNRRQIAIIDSLEDETSVNLTINIPTLAAYVFQKGLTFHRRTNKFKKAKDLFYIFYVLDNFLGSFPEIPREIADFKSQYSPRWFKTFIKPESFMNFRREAKEMAADTRHATEAPGGVAIGYVEDGRPSANAACSVHAVAVVSSEP